MKIQHPLLIKAVGVAGAFLVKNIVGTSKFHVRFRDPSTDPAAARVSGQRFIYAFYHELMLFPAYYWAAPEMQILISNHSDGELITQVIQRLGFSVIRGSTTRGGARALREMTHRVDQGHLCITPDGPRGPRRHVHQGLPFLGSQTGLPIVGVGLAFKRPWRAKSWDRFAVPKPFSLATCVALEPVVVPADCNRETLEAYRAQLESGMKQVTEEAEEWVESI